MLVLARQKGEAIQIGDDVQIVVVDIRGDKVRLGITAPPAVKVHRHEVAEAIARVGEGKPPMPLMNVKPKRTLRDNAERYGGRKP